MGGRIERGDDKKSVAKAGEWYSYNGEGLGQGCEAEKTFLKANVDIAEKIERTVREKAGLLKPAPEASPEAAPSEKKSAAARGTA